MGITGVWDTCLCAAVLCAIILCVFCNIQTCPRAVRLMVFYKHTGSERKGKEKEAKWGVFHLSTNSEADATSFDL